MKRFSQDPTVAPTPPLGAPAPPPLAPAAPPMDPMLGAAPPTPTFPGTDPMAGAIGTPAPSPAPSGDRQEIIGPIESLAQIFYDFDVTKFIQNNLHINSKDLASKIWEEYGGGEDGQPDNDKTGQRSENNLKLTPEDAKKERDNTKDTKWERFAEGKNIGDVISLDDLGKVVEGLIYGIVQKTNTTANTPPGGAPMGGGGLFASNKARIILAQALDLQGEFYLSDTIIKDIYKSL